MQGPEIPSSAARRSLLPGLGGTHEDPDEPVPDPRRPHRARGLAARPQGRARDRRPAAELPRRARRLAGGAARLRALPLRAAPRRARRCRRSSASRSPSPSTTAREPGHRACTPARPARPASALDEVALARECRLARRRARPRCCATSRPLVEQRGAAADAPPRGGARGRLDRRADPRGDRLRGARDASRRWSTSPATCRSTARSRSRAGAARRRSRRAMGRSRTRRRVTVERPEHATGAAARTTTRRSSSSAGAGPARSSTCCSSGGPLRFSRDRQRRARSSPTACCPSA